MNVYQYYDVKIEVFNDHRIYIQKTKPGSLIEIRDNRE